MGATVFISKLSNNSQFYRQFCPGNSLCVWKPTFLAVDCWVVAFIVKIKTTFGVLPSLTWAQSEILYLSESYIVAGIWKNGIFFNFRIILQIAFIFQNIWLWIVRIFSNLKKNHCGFFLYTLEIRWECERINFRCNLSSVFFIFFKKYYFTFLFKPCVPSSQCDLNLVQFISNYPFYRYFCW